ncbi:MAG TPA: MotA/TolQ/ExbB proton channel family protein [Kofleriaceae bacterium]|nr:MotA/TolQ/ExbB proton channel family protein [Kofleriaceae bacterium]
MMDKLLDIAGVGGTVVLVILLALSVLSIGIIIERFIFFRKRQVDAVDLAKTVQAKLASGDRDGLAALLAKHPSIEAAVLRDALTWYDAGPDSFDEMLKKGLTDRRKEFESGLVFLGTLGNNAPFIGLFGTVLGIIVAFRELSSAAANVAGGSGSMNNVMAGIAEALVSTAVGIIVAVPAVIFFNIFQKKTVTIEDNVGALGNAVLAHLKRDGDRPAPARYVAAPGPTPANGAHAGGVAAEGEA